MSRVIFFTQTAYVGGGMEHWLAALSSCLSDAGCDVLVALLEGPRFHRPERFLQRHPLKVETTIVRCDVGLREERVRSLLDVVRRYAPAVVVPVGSADAADAVALAKSKRIDARLVTCLHGQSVAALEESRRTSPYVDMAVSVSKLGADLLIDDIGMPAERVRHIPFGVQRVEAIAPRITGGRPELVVAYVGRLDHAEKRVLDLTGIVSELRDEPVRFEIAGDGPDRLALEHALADDVGAGRVRFRGYVEQERLSEVVYSSADALLIMSETEGGPIAAWEAMAHGAVPVVSDFVGRSHEPIWKPDLNSLVFPVGDVAEAAGQLRRLLDPGVRRMMSAVAREIPPAYLRDGFADSWKSVIHEALSLEPRGGGIVLEPPASEGRLRRLPVARRTLRKVVRAVGLMTDPADAGAEWPSAYGNSANGAS